MQLICGHCAAEFTATKRQAKRQRATIHGAAYCSPICQAAAIGLTKRRDVPFWGPCPQCGTMYHSRRRKKYCSLGCYVKSPDFAEVRMRAQQAAAARHPVKDRRNCRHCGVEFFIKPSSHKKFCCKNHSREYMAERFDRWIAAPESIALPQAYDEFLSQDELPCLVEGCGWHGRHLSAHMNFAHGVPAREFKRAAGFNLKTGVIGAGLRQQMEDRPHIQGATFGGPDTCGTNLPGSPQSYISRERIEHARKSRALAVMDGPGPERICLTCGSGFIQTTKFGVTRYCSIVCRDQMGIEKYNRRIYALACSSCGVVFLGKRAQQLRAGRGLVVACSFHCRQVLNSRHRRLDAARAAGVAS
jgi:hypothetical protein